MYFAGAVPYLRLKREGGALPYFTGAQLYLSGAETVEYSSNKKDISWFDISNFSLANDKIDT